MNLQADIYMTDQELLFAFSDHSKTRGYEMILKGDRFKSNKKNIFFM